MSKTSNSLSRILDLDGRILSELSLLKKRNARTTWDNLYLNS